MAETAEVSHDHAETVVERNRYDEPVLDTKVHNPGNEKTVVENIVVA